MSDFKIKKAIETDVDDIVHFIYELAKFERLEEQVKTNVEKLKRNLFLNKYAEVIMLLKGEKKIGFALYYFTFSTFEGLPSLYLEDLYIVPEERHNGYGKETLIYLANVALDNECGRFEWSCLNWNKRAIDFYQKFGALPQDEWTLFRLEGSKLIGYKK